MRVAPLYGKSVTKNLLGGPDDCLERIWKWLCTSVVTTGRDKDKKTKMSRNQPWGWWQTVAPSKSSNSKLSTRPTPRNIRITWKNYLWNWKRIFSLSKFSFSSIAFFGRTFHLLVGQTCEAESQCGEPADGWMDGWMDGFLACRWFQSLDYDLNYLSSVNKENPYWKKKANLENSTNFNNSIRLYPSIHHF